MDLPVIATTAFLPPKTKNDSVAENKLKFLQQFQFQYSMTETE